MLPELQQLIRLQQLENSATEARSKIEGLPSRLEVVESRVVERQEAVQTAAQRLDEHKSTRAALEKDVAEVQSRLNRFQEQLMAVKTNKEYHAMQSEIASGEQELRRLEDQLLERMLEADDLGQEVQRAEKALSAAQADADTERSKIEDERGTLEQDLVNLDTERAGVASQLTPQAMSLFDTLTRGRKGVAVVEARDGRCTSCQVRLRPQLFNNVRANAELIQCESCQRILFYVEARHAAS